MSQSKDILIVEHMKISVILALLLFSSNIAAENKIYGHVLPLNTEKLSNSIILKQCPNFKITEWRPNIDTTIISKIETTCNLAITNFIPFIQTQNLNVSNVANVSWSISLLPIDTNYRNLNDIIYRFNQRSLKYHDDGLIYIIPGDTQHQLHAIFLFNDTNNSKFYTILAHEIFHALSYQSGIYQSHTGDKGLADEKLAVKFTVYLKLGK